MSETNKVPRGNNKRSKMELPDDLKDDATAIAYKILCGESNIFDHDRVNLLVPSEDADRILDALQNNTRNSSHTWSVEEDEAPIADISRIPSCFALPVRTIPKDIPSGEKESELLDWLIHGESYFPEKYLIVHYKSYIAYIRGEVRKAYKITKKEHMGFYDYCDRQSDMVNEYRDPDESHSVESCYLVDRPGFKMLCKEHSDMKFQVVDDNLFESFREMSANEDMDSSELCDWVGSQFWIGEEVS